ncbi:ubiquitin recognition factor in ER-associated degradation protein 1-like [Rhopilema esculentum]|uniref:ubiquitin recognition factor in ER-associated degradation protein 1-like n=1 Tax=Rhopilema esculentum TaxID=499914 RepID=UPI0031DF0995
MFGFGNVFDNMPRSFNTQYRCFSVSILRERDDVERGGKIIMPPSALDLLTRLNIVYPMLFKLSNSRKERATHCGVLEFVADEGKVYIPYWMMRNLLLEEGDLVQVQSASLPVATYSKFQPQSVEFLDITNPKAVLENALRSFACLTTGDMIAFTYNDRVYEILVMETKPAQAISIIECDMQVEFAAPVGYVEPSRSDNGRKDSQENAMPSIPAELIKTPKVKFPGAGLRPDGKGIKKCQQQTDEATPTEIKKGVPDLKWNKKKIIFVRNRLHAENDKQNEAQSQETKPFSGDGKTLRQKKF